MAQAFWGNIQADPKRKFRWFITASPGEGLDGELLRLACKSIDKPKFEITSTEHQFINHHFYFPSRVKWTPISVTFVDLASSAGGGESDVSKLLHSILSAANYKAPASFPDTTFSITKQRAVEAFGDEMSIQQINSEGAPIETWKLKNPWVSKIEFGSLEYSSEDLVEITIEIQYDYALLE